MPNYAFENGRADKQRALGERQWRRAAERGRWASLRKAMRIRKSVANDFEAIFTIINDAAQAYRGVIPSDRWHEPYMPTDELAKEIASGVIFWMAEDNGRLLGVMGIQDKEDVALVRHAYTATTL